MRSNGKGFRMRKAFKIVGAVFLTIIILLILAFAAISLDLSSYGATGSETLNPQRASVGRALVIYSPGFSGASRDAATKIAGDLQQKGYVVDLAGVRSGTAGNLASYGIIVAGGPMYWGQVSSSIDNYLKTHPSNSKLGVFGTTGSSEYLESDFKTFSEQVASNICREDATVKLILVGNETRNCADLVSKLVQQG